LELTKDESKIIYDELVKNLAIVERLKKRIEELDVSDKEFPDNVQRLGSETTLRELQKILEGKDGIQY